MLFNLIVGLLLMVVSAKKSSFKIINAANHPLDVLWLDERTNKLSSVLTKPFLNNSEVVLSSFSNHKFRIKFLDGGVETMFTKGSKDQTIVVKYNELMNSLSFYDLTQHQHVKQHVKNAILKECGQQSFENPEDFKKCVTGTFTNQIKQAHESKNLLRKYQNEVSNQLRNYTCADLSLTTAIPISTYDFPYEGKSYKINNLLDLANAKIWYVNNFITPEECQILETHGRPRLLRATVAAEDGTSVVSENRKANQAVYDLHQEHGESDPLWKLHKRVLALANRHGNFTLDSPGQEGFTIIQYNPSDEYSPHCDGSCDNSFHIKTGRVATAVMYCKEPTKGGATVFTRSNILVQPKMGSATFFSYVGPDGRMDDGFTEHSGCPVLEGEKWITTFWMRKGVDEVDNWMLYDPSGVRILESN